jgi:starch synthase
LGEVWTHIVFAASECVPFARTGELDGAIEEWDPMMGTATGFKFATLNPDGLLAAIDRALIAFPGKSGWKQRMRNGVAQHYGWERPAREYAAVYEEMARHRG